VSTVDMMGRIREVSPCFKARLAGGLFMLLVLTAACTEFFFLGWLSFAAVLAAGIIEGSCTRALASPTTCRLISALVVSPPIRKV